MCWLFKKKKKLITSNNITWSEQENNLLELINDHRYLNGLPLLSKEDSFYKQAKALCVQDIKTNLSHDDLNVATKILTDKGFKWIAENIGRNYKSNEVILNAWLNSPRHAKHINRKQHKYTGIAIIKDSKGNNYYCQLFGR